MTQPLGDPDLAAMVGLTGGEHITPEQAEAWLQRPAPTPSLRKQITDALADMDPAEAVLSKVIQPLLKARDERIEELSRDLRDTHQRLIGERRITAAYSARFGPLAVSPDLPDELIGGAR